MILNIKKQHSDDSNDILLYSQINDLYSHHQRNILPKQMLISIVSRWETNTQTLTPHRHTHMERGVANLELTPLNGMSPLNLSTQISGYPEEVEAERIEEPWQMEVPRRKCVSESILLMI